MKSHNITQKSLDVIGYGNIAGVDTWHFSKDAIGISAIALSLRGRLGIADNTFVFCFLGRLNFDKGLNELIQAFVRLSNDVHLLVVGNLDATAPPDDKTLAQIKSNSHVHEIGFVDDVRPMLLASDALVLPSYREGFPNVVLQAGAMGLPVIATNINGSNEVIEPGFNGWLVPVRDADALLDAMQHAILQPKSERARMGENARRRIQERYERQAHWDRLVQFYNDLIKSNN